MHYLQNLLKFVHVPTNNRSPKVTTGGDECMQLHSLCSSLLSQQGDSWLQRRPAAVSQSSTTLGTQTIRHNK